jgi:hypothetical protein
MTNVIPFPGTKKTLADIIEEISERCDGDIVVLGYDKEDKEFFIGTIDDAAEVNWLLDRLKFKMQLEFTSS